VPPLTDLDFGDAWTLAHGEFQGKPMILRVRDVDDAVQRHPDLDTRLTVAWSYAAPDEHGFPAPDDAASMDAFEHRLFDAFERANHAIGFAVITHDGVREWVFYTGDLEEAQKRLNDEFLNDARDEPFPLRFDVADDPDWDEYASLLAALRQAGETGAADAEPG
jgi:hypothetical protein